MTQYFIDSTIDGNSIKPPSYQMDRQDYLKYKKIMENNGGKWKGGRTQAFQFEFDPTDLLEDLRAGKTRNRKKENQAFDTPLDLAEQMARKALAFVPEGGKILEPSAGVGALAQGIRNIFTDNEVTPIEIDLHVIELDTYRREQLEQQGYTIACDDFLEYDDKHEYYPDDGYDAIIANPPFTKGAYCEHIKKMYEDVKVGGIVLSVAMASFKWMEIGKQREFRTWLKSVGGTYEDLPEGTFRKSGTNVQTVLVRIVKLNHEEAKTVSREDLEAAAEMYDEITGKEHRNVGYYIT